MIELIARTAIRPGNESYARLNGTRGATTLLKSNVALEDDCFVLSFKAKGGKAVRKECDAAKLVRAIPILRQFQASACSSIAMRPASCARFPPPP